MTITEEQEKFIWLAHAECKSFSDIAKLLGVPRETLTKWERDLRPLWQVVAANKRLHSIKGITLDFRSFHNWLIAKEGKKKCCYCGITEEDLGTLYCRYGRLTKRSRGWKLELDRKEPNLPYDNLENIVYACYWCNNAKTDTFTHEEFLEIGKAISNIWKQRLTNGA